jgi:hypothetical protein
MLQMFSDADADSTDDLGDRGSPAEVRHCVPITALSQLLNLIKLRKSVKTRLFVFLMALFATNSQCLFNNRVCLAKCGRRCVANARW